MFESVLYRLIKNVVKCVEPGLAGGWKTVHWLLQLKAGPEENPMSSRTPTVMPWTLSTKWHHLMDESSNALESPLQEQLEACIVTSCQLGSHMHEQVKWICWGSAPFSHDAFQETFNLTLSWLIGVFMNWAHFSGNRIGIYKYTLRRHVMRMLF